MDDLTPGKKLILDLLAKSIAKVQAAEAKNQVAKTDVEVKDKKRYKSSKELVQKEEVINEEKENVARKVKKERSRIKDEKRRALKQENVVGNKVEQIQVKTEYTEIKTEDMDAKKESRSLVKVEAENQDAKTQVGERSDSSKGKVEKIEIKTEEKDNDKWKDKKDKKDKKERKQIKKENRRPLHQEIMDILPPKPAKAEPLENKTEHIEIEKVELDHKELRNNKKVSKELNKKKKVEQEFVNADSNKNPKSNSKHYTKHKRFTREEDAILLQAMEHSGGKVNFQEISKDLPGRHPSSIINRVYLLKKNGNTRAKYTVFTLTEDLVTLDAVLKHLDEQSLEDLNLPQTDWVKVADQIGRERFAPSKRWEYTLKPWILQHYSGTLNLDIKRPLANYVSEHFKDVNSIDWPSVISQPLFTGHTEVSLRIKLSELMKIIKRYRNEGSEVITLEMIAEFANTKYVLRKVSETKLKRQQEIIDYFECYCEMNGINKFL